MKCQNCGKEEAITQINNSFVGELCLAEIQGTKMESVVRPSNAEEFLSLPGTKLEEYVIQRVNGGFAVKSPQGKYYVVTQDYCSCEGYLYRKYCKHMTTLKGMF